MEQNGLQHAYLITAHNKKAQLLNLLRLLNDPKNDIYIHIDKKAQDITEAEMRAAAPDCRVAFVPRLDARWGSEVFIDAIVSLIELASREEHVFYHLLSGVDLPLKTQREIHAFFAEHGGLEYIAFDRETIDETVLLMRLGYWRTRRPINPFLKRVFRQAEPHLLAIQRALRVNRVRNAGIVFQKGAVWFSITHAFAVYVKENAPKYRKYFKKSVCADEIWMQTILANSPFMKNRSFFGWDDELPATMRYVDWSGGGVSPRILTSADYDALMQSDMLFARKFDDVVDADIIRRIENKIRSGD